jgi:hypothetical protein
VMIHSSSVVFRGWLSGGLGGSVVGWWWPRGSPMVAK